jgi:hypothetical protein
MSSRGPSWGRWFFPQGYWTQVPVADVQTQVRRQFRRWGVPNALRVDNGNPWGSWSDLPTVLTLWLLGLGVQVLWNDPGRPQQNSKVERSQGTGKRWAEPQQCWSVPELQARLQEADHIQRECYPAVGQLSRLAAFPQLHHSRQPYSRRWEADTWSLERVTQHLADYVVGRVVSSGRVTLYDQRYYVGRAYDRQTLFVHFDPDSGCWVIKEEQGREVRSHPARGITQAQIVKLNIRGTN